jgi:hypothetical protein
MDFETWERIAKRQLWYKQVVIPARLEDLEKALNRCCQKAPSISVLRELRDQMEANDVLTTRIERHKKRMDRHLARGMALVPTRGTA